MNKKILPKRSGQRYSEEDKQFIRDNYKSMSDLEMAIELHRTISTVKNLRISLKLNRKIYYKIFVMEALKEADDLIKLENKCIKMRQLIAVCEETDNSYIKDKAKMELKKLSGIK